MNQSKLRIGVLMGGRSIEREVSFNSGRTICDHLDTERYQIIPIFQTETGKLYLLPQHFLHRGKISDFAHRLAGEAEAISWDKLKKTVDFIYIALHGRYGEDGTVQGMLEVLGIPYLGSKVLGSALGMDKSRQKEFLTSHGVDVPRGISIPPAQLASLTPSTISQQLTDCGIALPVIVKPAHEGSSLGIAIANTPDELIIAINHAATIDQQHPQTVVAEELLVGMEFVCVLLEKVRNTTTGIQRSWFPLPITEVAIEATAKFFDYEQKYMPGRALKITPARCSSETTQRIVDACRRATAALGFSTISRIDGFATTDGRIVLIDPNTLTGMSPATFLFHQAAEIGMSHTDLINFLIENELHAYGMASTTVLPAHREGNTMSTAPANKIRVAVLLGGDSNERETSLESGRNICYKLSPNKYEVIPVFVNDKMELFKLSQQLLIKNSTRAISAMVTDDLRLEWSDLGTVADFVFIGLHGGKGENGAVQGTLEMLDLPYNGPGVLASALCMNKYKTNEFLRNHGFDVPSSLLLEQQSWDGQEASLATALTEAKLLLPVIVKPHDDGCSVMVSKATSLTELATQLNIMFTSGKTVAMIEELIIGAELTVGVIGNDQAQALPPSLAVAKGGILSMEEKFLPGAGENQTPAPLPKHALELVQATIARAFQAVGCKGYSRIDCFYQAPEQSPTGASRVVLLEFNTLPALTPATCIFHQAAELGIKPMEFIDQIIDLGFKLHTHAVPAPVTPVAKKPEEQMLSLF